MHEEVVGFGCVYSPLCITRRKKIITCVAGFLCPRYKMVRANKWVDEVRYMDAFHKGAVGVLEISVLKL